MKKLIIIFLTFTGLAQAQPQIKWPDHKKAVIILTYDDGLYSQLNIAIPQLDSAHLKGTFFLSGDLNYETIPRWRKASRKGHELGNHSIYHPCMSANDNPVASDHYTPAMILEEIGVMNNFLFAVDGKSSHTYAYPCTETTVGGKNYVDSLRRSGLIKYARVGGDKDAIITDFKNLDPLLVPSYGLEDNTTADQLITYVKTVQKKGGMGILMFHGIGGDYITTPALSHKKLINYLAKNKKDIWVATFQQVMEYISKAVNEK
ncbi:polysaccharide deacetylase family protein [Mucilaginibacter gotjawali]|uniref:Peptidoglycan/xylan/chitin deacetylase (PgdA/CDA1 family) n=2 Tax=Mucilaginibacter gotjawali TaxID=1550579 RepID=A0A839SHU4_9SPHI|nr:polysaccharide deacetylase family protein [Mucilaginibacter gotjawali]MBB3056097.1 peptidoglycan/xylan/chitin deacetylase (PgdA/CDA1 family) [Mucilaginibacter gotjawali]BAU53566.1 Polysaccharide deacetylase [Mucilaginibacter gotjawali]